MTEQGNETGLIALPSPGARVVVRYLIATGQATDALGELLGVDDHVVVVQGVRGVERIPVDDIIAAKEVPPRAAPRRFAAGAPTVRRSPTQGAAMRSDREHTSPEPTPGSGEHEIPELEVDQTVAPRPEEEIADVARAEPDPDGHGARSE